MKGIPFSELQSFLEEKANQYEVPGFIENDPILIPHQFTKKEDIEIAGFLTATIAWGNRNSILKNASKLMRLMDENPHEFILQLSNNELDQFSNFVHRTFNGIDTAFFLKSLKNIYSNHNGLEAVFTKGYLKDHSLISALIFFREIFLESPHQTRSEKHVANVLKSSSGKRLCMYLRWMVRSNKRHVDFGIWKNIPSSALMLPLDVHTGNVSRKLGLLQRKQNDWKAVDEISSALKKMDTNDPIKYDFALFGLGVNKEI